MKAIGWLLGIVYFFAILVFAVNNAEPVTLRLTSKIMLGEMPLVVVLLASFALGFVLGLAALAPKMLLMKRQLAQMRRPPTVGQSSPEVVAERIGDRLASAARSGGAVGVLDGDERLQR
jgi:uncharacterized integral membrane protein